MLDKLRDRWNSFQEGEPGSRFQNRFHRAHAKGRSIFHRVLVMGGGVIVFAAGIFFLPAPGPGMVIVAIGAGMIAQESLAMAKTMDLLEVWGRRVFRRLKKRWDKLPGVVRAVISVVAVAATMGLAYMSLRLTIFR